MFVSYLGGSDFEMALNICIKMWLNRPTMTHYDYFQTDNKYFELIFVINKIQYNNV